MGKYERRKRLLALLRQSLASPSLSGFPLDAPWPEPKPRPADSIGDEMGGSVVSISSWHNGKESVPLIVVDGANACRYQLLGATHLVPIGSLFIGAQVLLEFATGGASGYGEVVEEGKLGDTKALVKRGGHWRIKSLL